MNLNSLVSQDRLIVPPMSPVAGGGKIGFLPFQIEKGTKGPKLAQDSIRREKKRRKRCKNCLFLITLT